MSDALPETALAPKPKMPNVTELRELLYIWGEAMLDMEEAECSEQDTGACASMGSDHYPYCDGCEKDASAFATLQGIEGVMREAYERLREAGYER